MNTSDDNGSDSRRRFNKIRFSELRSPVVFLATGFGSGLSSIAPGTLGTLVAVPFAAALMMAPQALQWIVPIVAFLLGIPLCSACTAKLDVHDHPGIVWDEIAAFLFFPLVLPAQFVWLIPAFLLFRFFDIVKPWPIRDLDHRLHGGLGIMLDDLVAAIFAAFCLAGFRWLVT
jgi:phosphatidylglycerophosphatase A